MTNCPEEELVSLLDRIGNECKRAYNLTRLLFQISIGCAIFVYFTHDNLFSKLLDGSQHIWIIIVVLIVAFWFRRCGELYRKTASMLNDPIAKQYGGTLPMDENIVFKTTISINQQLKELYENHGIIIKCPIHLNIPGNLELYYAFKKAHPDELPINTMMLTKDNREQLISTGELTK
jgi:hypothetical protein